MTNTRLAIKRIAYVGFGLYFSLLLFPKVAPGLGASPFLLVPLLSLVLVVPLLILLGFWGTTALVLSKARNRPIGPRSKTAGRTALAGLCGFAVVSALWNVLPAPLPTGSYDKSFDHKVWVDAKSANNTGESITPRQQMLADVVKRLPGKNREEIVKMLGPSFDQPGYMSTKGDLIYPTGLQRDFYLAMDSEWLLIKLDEDGLYKRYAIVSD